MRFWITVAGLSILLGLAGRFGRGPERYAAGILFTNFVFQLVNFILRGPFNFMEVDPVLAGIDLGTFFALTYVALNANRLWPLVLSALQMLVVVAHVSVLTSRGWDQVYWGMMAISQYLQLFVLGAGTLSHHFRERRTGRYRSWRLVDKSIKGLSKWNSIPNG